MKYKITLNKETCIASGRCEALCPDFWEVKGEKARLKSSKKQKNLEIRIIDSKKFNSCNLAAEKNCPTMSIKVEKIT